MPAFYTHLHTKQQYINFVTVQVVVDTGLLKAENKNFFRECNNTEEFSSLRKLFIFLNTRFVPRALFSPFHFHYTKKVAAVITVSLHCMYYNQNTGIYTLTYWNKVVMRTMQKRRMPNILHIGTDENFVH